MARRQSSGRNRAAIFLFVSLTAAVGATGFIWNMIRGFQEELAKAQVEETKVAVVAANVDLYQGDTIKAEDLVLIELPPDMVPDGVFNKIEDLRGRVPRERILANDLVRAERLAEVDAGVGLNAIIPRGMRAVAVNVTDASAVSGFLVPGNFVDVLVTIRTTDRSTNTITLLQAVKVLAVDTQLGGAARSSGDSSRPSVTLAVSPEDAEKLAHAQAEGDLILTLRNDVDVEREEVERVDTTKLIGRNVTKVEEVKPSTDAVRKAAPSIREVKQDASQTDQIMQIIRGNKTTTTGVREDGSLAPAKGYRGASRPR